MIVTGRIVDRPLSHTYTAIVIIDLISDHSMSQHRTIVVVHLIPDRSMRQHRTVVVVHLIPDRSLSQHGTIVVVHLIPDRSLRQHRTIEVCHLMPDRSVSQHGTMLVNSFLSWAVRDKNDCLVTGWRGSDGFNHPSSTPKSFGNRPRSAGAVTAGLRHTMCLPPGSSVYHIYQARLRVQEQRLCLF